MKKIKQIVKKRRKMSFFWLLKTWEIKSASNLAEITSSVFLLYRVTTFILKSLVMIIIVLHY